jgi:hypothetical protein
MAQKQADLSLHLLAGSAAEPKIWNTHKDQSVCTPTNDPYQFALGTVNNR